MAQDYELAAASLRLLAHPERLKILDAVRRSSECVCHLEALLGKPQPYVSQQLRLLREAGFIDVERAGQNVYYRLVDDEVARWLNTLLGPIDGELTEIARHKRVIACPCPKCSEETHPVTQPIQLMERLGTKP
jgi:DNA-binding transcriptional ArsR family regulator